MSLNKISSSVNKIRNTLSLAQTAVSKMPDLTNATKTNIVALTRQQESQNIPVSNSLLELSGKLKREEDSKNITTQLSNFTPEIIDSVVQRRRGTNSQIEGETTTNKNTRSKAKSRILKGVDPLTAKTAEYAKDILVLGAQKTQLTGQLNKTEAQISTLSSKIQSLTLSLIHI
jgi:chromosome segregation ATPase